jgi:hypothetical protein
LKKESKDSFHTTRNGHSNNTAVGDDSTTIKSEMDDIHSSANGHTRGSNEDAKERKQAVNRISSNDSLTTKSVDFAIDESSIVLSKTNPKKAVLLSKDTKAYIDELRYSDQKTIQELAIEVKRLTKLLPRSVLAKDEEVEEENDRRPEEEEEENEQEQQHQGSNINSESSESQKLLNNPKRPNRIKGADPLQFPSFSLPKSAVSSISDRIPQYTFSQLISAFICGSILMLAWLWRYLPS